MGFISISPDEEDRVSISSVNSGDCEPTNMVMPTDYGDESFLHCGVVTVTL